VSEYPLSALRRDSEAVSQKYQVTLNLSTGGLSEVNGLPFTVGWNPARTTISETLRNIRCTHLIFEQPCFHGRPHPQYILWATRFP